MIRYSALMIRNCPTKCMVQTMHLRSGRVHPQTIIAESHFDQLTPVAISPVFGLIFGPYSWLSPIIRRSPTFCSYHHTVHFNYSLQPFFAIIRSFPRYWPNARASAHRQDHFCENDFFQLMYKFLKPHCTFVCVFPNMVWKFWEPCPKIRVDRLKVYRRSVSGLSRDNPETERR